MLFLFVLAVLYAATWLSSRRLPNVDRWRVAVAGVEVDGQPGGISPWLRLLVQPVFVWLAVWSTRETGAGDDSQPSAGRTRAPLEHR